MGKRLFDVVGALVLLVLVLPFFPFIALWIKATSPGSVIFRQKRIGYQGREFVIFKLRTMREFPAREHEIAMTGDDRVTKPGRFLRATYLDELPQLVNVLRGEMSLVGPRPFMTAIAEVWAQQIPGFAERLSVRPGLTGLSQLRGRSWFLRYPRNVVRLDCWYIARCNFLLDLRILLQTIPMVLRQQGI